MKIMITKGGIYPLQLFFYEEMPGDKIRYAEPINLVWREVSACEFNIAPTLAIPLRDADNFLRSLRDALDGVGVSSASDARIEGTLEATRVHLQDMRRLVFVIDGKPEQGGK